MLEFLKNLFTSGSFIPHGHCYLWKSELVWLHIVSDSLIALAYYSIPITLIYFVHKRQDLPFDWIFLLFGTFIIACGTTHLMEIWTLWHPTYWLLGLVKSVTAIVSVYTALELMPLVPKALALPSPVQLEAINRELLNQITKRKLAEEALQTANQKLEIRVEERTTELRNANQQLQTEIVERKQVEVALRNALQKLSFHVENSPLAVVEWNHHFQLQHWSQKAEQIFGWKAEEVFGRSWQEWQFIFEEDLELVNTHCAALGDGSKPSNVSRNRNYTKYGSVIYCEWYNSALLDESGKLVSVLSLVQDISDRNRTEKQIKELNQDLERRVFERTAQLEATNKELEAFSYSVSHDLRAPLRSIDGFSQTLIERYTEQLDDKGKHYLKRVRAATQRMGEMIDDLLDLSRVTRSEMQRQRVYLSSLVQEITSDLQQTKPERSAEFVIAPGVLVEGDPQLLKVVLENLLSNAWKFTSNQISARIEFGITSQQNVKQAYFVKDNGAGFDMEYADKLFGAFQRLHTTDEFPGTGIGLATVQRIIRRHGGNVWAEGAVGQGATFYFML